MSTNARLNISAEETGAVDPTNDDRWAMGFERVQVAFPAEDGYEAVCIHCGEPVVDEGGEVYTHADGESYCDEDAWLAAADEATEDDEGGSAADHYEGTYAEPETGPGSWCNSASVIVDEEENSVSVSISVGDPRGGFYFTVRRVPTITNGAGEVENPELAGKLILHTPYPGEGLPHMGLTELHPGTFLIGQS